MKKKVVKIAFRAKDILKVEKETARFKNYFQMITELQDDWMVGELCYTSDFMMLQMVSDIGFAGVLLVFSPQDY